MRVYLFRNRLTVFQINKALFMCCVLLKVALRRSPRVGRRGSTAQIPQGLEFGTRNEPPFLTRHVVIAGHGGQRPDYHGLRAELEDLAHAKVGYAIDAEVKRVHRTAVCIVAGRVGNEMATDGPGVGGWQDKLVLEGPVGRPAVLARLGLVHTPAVRCNVPLPGLE